MGAPKYTIDMKLTPIPNTGEINGSMRLCNNTNVAFPSNITFFWPSVVAFGGPAATINGSNVTFNFQSWEIPGPNSCKDVSVWGGHYSGNFVLPPYGLTPGGDTVEVLVTDPKFLPKSYNANPWKYKFSKECFIPSPNKLCLGQALIAEWSGPSNKDYAEVRVPTNRKSWALAAAHTHRLFTNMVGAEITTLNFSFAQSMIEGRMGCDASFSAAGGASKLNFRAISVSGGCFQILSGGWAQLQQYYPDLYNNPAHPLSYGTTISGDNFVTSCLSKAMYDYTSFIYWEKKFCYNPIDFFAKAVDPYVAEEVLAYAYHDGSEGAGNLLANVFTTQRAAYEANPNVISTLVGLNGSGGLSYGERMRNNLIQLGNDWATAPALVSNDAKYNWGTGTGKPSYYQNYGCYNECFNWSDIDSYIDEAAALFWHADVPAVKKEVKKEFDKLRPYTVTFNHKDSVQVCEVSGKIDKCANTQTCAKKVWVYTYYYDTLYSGCVNYEDLGPVIDAIVLAFPAYSGEKGFGETYFASACPSPTANLNYFRSPICSGEKTELYVNLFGAAPFSYSVQGPNNVIYTRTNVSVPTDVIVVSEPGEYKLLSMTDSKGGIFLNCHKANVLVPKKLTPNGEWDKGNVGKCEVGCLKNTSPLVVKFTGGSAPWSFTYLDANGATKTVNNINTNTYTISATPDKGTYYLKQVKSGLCDTSLNEKIEICNDTCIKPTATIWGVKKVCAGDSVQLNLSMTGKAPFTVYVKIGNTQKVYTASDTTFKFYAKVAGTYTIDSVASGKCSDAGKGSATLTVDAIADVNIGPADTVICTGSSLVLNAGTGYTSYTWLNGSTTPTVNVTTSGKYKVTVKNATGCSKSDSINVTIGNSIAVKLGNDTTLCSGASLILNAGTGFSKYTWNPGAETSSTKTVNTAGTYIVNVENTAGCKGADTIVISVGAAVLVDLGNDTTSICPGNSYTLNPSVTGGNNVYTYQWSGGSTSTQASVNASSGGWYKLLVKDGVGCSAKDSAFIKQSAHLSISLADKEICEGDSVKLNAGYDHGNYKVNWNTGYNQQFMTVKIAGIYGVVVDDGHGCSGSDSMTLTVNPLPIVNLGVDKNVCAGSTVTLVNTIVNSTYINLWSTLATTPSITVGSAGNYILGVKDSKGCVASDTVKVNIIALPTPNVLRDTAVCKGNGVTFDESSYNNGNGTYTYKWSDKSTASTLVLNNITTPTTASVEVTDQYGCKGSEQVNVTILAGLPVTISGDSVLCAGESTTLNTNYKAANGYQFMWSIAATTESISVNTAANITVTVDNGLGCVGTDNMKVVVNPLPDLSTISNTEFFCEGSSLNIGKNLGNQYSYTWNSGENTPIISVTQGNTYQLHVINIATQCFSDVNITVTENPSPLVDLPADIDDCEGQSFVVAPVSVNNAYTYKWNGVAGSASKTIAASGKYILTAVDANLCTAKDSIQVNLRVVPVVNLMNGADTIVLCAGEAETLEAGNNGMTYLWSNDAISQNIAVSAKGNYSVVVTNGKCSDQDDIYVNVIDLPTTLLDHQQKTIFCFEEEAPIRVSANGFTPSSSYSYVWNTGETQSGINADKEGIYTLTLTAKNCSVKDEIKLIDYCESSLFIPNTFTPNGDNKNEVFKVEGKHVNDFEMYIFNRWGELIFYSNDISHGWDGKYSGQKVQEDVYVWKLRYSVNKETGKKTPVDRTGVVTVLY